MQAGELILGIPHADAEQGGRHDFEQLMAAHQPRVLRTAYRLLGRMEDAQDVCQEVFLRLLKHLDALDASPQAWLYRVTVNLCNDHHRKHHRLTAVEFEPADPAPGFAQALESAIEKEERKRLLTLGLRRLSEREREAIVLRDIEGLSTSEVATILGVEEVTVRSQCSAARAKLAIFVRRMAAPQKPPERTPGSVPGPGTSERRKGASDIQA